MGIHVDTSSVQKWYGLRKIKSLKKDSLLFVIKGNKPTTMLVSFEKLKQNLYVS